MSVGNIMQLGEMIANFFAALLLACILGAIFVLASQPIWPEQAMGRMVILVPPDGVTTGSIKAVTHSQLPDSVEGNLVQPRPQRNAFELGQVRQATRTLGLSTLQSTLLMKRPATLAREAGLDNDTARDPARLPSPPMIGGEGLPQDKYDRRTGVGGGVSARRSTAREAMKSANCVARGPNLFLP